MNEHLSIHLLMRPARSHGLGVIASETDTQHDVSPNNSEHSVNINIDPQDLLSYSRSLLFRGERLAHISGATFHTGSGGRSHMPIWVPSLRTELDNIILGCVKS